MSFNPKHFDEILQQMIDWAVAHTTKITDFNKGSINRAILGAIAILIEEGYYDIMLGWKDSLRYALRTSLNFDRTTGEEATGNVIFSRSTAAPGDITIDIGTIVATADGVRFITTQVGTISTGNTDSANVSIEAEEVGANGNALANTVIILVSVPSGVETVDNAAALTGGVDIESDDDYDQTLDVVRSVRPKGKKYR